MRIKKYFPVDEIFLSFEHININEMKNMDRKTYAEGWYLRMRERLEGHDVHVKYGPKNCKKEVQRRLIRLPAFRVIPENRTTILRFDKEIGLNRNYYTRGHYIMSLARLSEKINKPFRDMTKEDIVDFASGFKEENSGKAAKVERCRVSIKCFFKWLEGGNEEIPKKIKWWKRDETFNKIQKTREKSLKKDVLSKAEVLKMVEACSHIAHKALIITLFESSFRVGEIVGCRIRDLEFKKGYATLTFPLESETGAVKTETYEATLFDSEPYLRQLVNNHPFKNNPDAPLFYNTRSPGMPRPITRSAVGRMVRQAGKYANLGKRVYPHLLRHSISTIWAREGYTATEINLSSGRNEGSRSAHIYIHQTSEDVKKKRLQRRGLLKDGTPEEENPMQPKKCWRCDRTNPADFAFCGTCGASLNPEVKKIVQERTKSALEDNGVFTELIKDPDIARTIGRKLAKNPGLLQKILAIAGE